MTIILLILSVIAYVFKFFPPKKINSFYGYRTPTSMKNIENWNLANTYSSNVMLVSMFSLLLVSTVSDLLAIEARNWLIGLLFLSFALIFFLTEKKLKQHEKSK